MNRIVWWRLGGLTVLFSLVAMVLLPRGCAHVESKDDAPKNLIGTVTKLKVVGDKDLNESVESGLVYHMLIEVMDKEGKKGIYTVVANSRVFGELVFVEVGSRVEFRFKEGGVSKWDTGYDIGHQMLEEFSLKDKFGSSTTK